MMGEKFERQVGQHIKIVLDLDLVRWIDYD